MARPGSKSVKSEGNAITKIRKQQKKKLKRSNLADAKVPWYDLDQGVKIRVLSSTRIIISKEERDRIAEEEAYARQIPGSTNDQTPATEKSTEDECCIGTTSNENSASTSQQVPGTSANATQKPETPSTEPTPKQPIIEVETIESDTDDETDSAPTTSRPRIKDPNNPYAYQCNLSQEKLQNLADDDQEEMDDDSLKAFLNIVRIESRKPVIVVSSHYRNRVPRLGLTKSLYDGKLEDFETAIIPVHMPSTEAAHWVLGIYRRNKSIFYYDSLGLTYGMAEVNGERIVTLVEDWVAETLKSAVRDITGDAQLDPKLKAVPLDVPLFEHYCPQHRINPQMDGVNCGFHIALIAEAFLMNNGEVFLENFDIATERTRILDILSGLLNDNYRYNPRDVCYAPKDVDLDLEMKQLDNAMNAKGKVLDSFEYAAIENECVEKSATKDEEKAPDNVPEKMSQLVESAESNTLENDRPKARNERQSASPAPDSEEAASKPDQEMEKTEVTTLPDAVGLQHICKDTGDPEMSNLETTVQLKTKNVANENKRDGPKVSEAGCRNLLPYQEMEKTEVTTLPDAVGLQHICKGTEDPEKPNLETTVQLNTKDDAEKVANENKRDGTKASEAGCRNLSFETFIVVSIAPMAPLSSSQAEISDQRSEPAKMPASSQETMNIKENIMPEADDPNRTPNFSESKISPKVNVKENVALKSDVVPYITRQFLQNFHEVKVNANRTFPFSTYQHTPIVPTEQSSIFQEPKVPDSIRKRAKSIKKIGTPMSLKKHCWSPSSKDILESLKASNLPKAESDSRDKNLASLQKEKFLQKSPFSSANKRRSPSIFHNDEDLLPSDLDENLSMQSRRKIIDEKSFEENKMKL